MSLTQTYNFCTTYNGDSFQEEPFAILLNNNPLNLVGASISIWLTDANGNKVKEFSTANNGVQFTDALNGKFITNFGVINLKPQVYNYTIKITLASGVIKTWISGTLPVE